MRFELSNYLRRIYDFCRESGIKWLFGVVFVLGWMILVSFAAIRNGETLLAHGASIFDLIILAIVGLGTCVIGLAVCLAQFEKQWMLYRSTRISRRGSGGKI